MNKLQPLIPSKLAVGPRPPSVNFLKELRAEGITVIVDLNQDLEEMKLAEQIGLKYCSNSKLKIENNYKPISVEALEYVTRLIHRLISEGNFVYLHCTAALGRSPTIAAAYIIYLGKTKIEAISEVRKIRQLAWSGRDGNYAASLDEFEKKCRVK